MAGKKGSSLVEKAKAARERAKENAKRIMKKGVQDKRDEAKEKALRDR